MSKPPNIFDFILGPSRDETKPKAKMPWTVKLMLAIVISLIAGAAAFIAVCIGTGGGFD